MLSQQELDAIAQLQFFATDVVQGLAIGHHLSPHRGTSMQFKEHRAYVPGDEIRSLDWKLFGKTDRLYVRQFEDESNLRCMLLIDRSGSMAYQGKAQHSKLEYAARLAACIAALLIKQQDAVGIATLTGDSLEVLPPRSSPSYLQSIIKTLALLAPSNSAESESQESICRMLPDVASSLKSCDVVLLLSDCFEATAELASSLFQFKNRRRQVLVLQILDRDELEFPFQKQIQFQSLERANRIQINASTFRNEYVKRMTAFQEELATHLAESQIEHLVFTSETPHRQVLSELVDYQTKRR